MLQSLKLREEHPVSERGTPRSIELHLARYQSHLQKQPFWTVLTIEMRSTNTILDLLRAVSYRQLPDLGFRYSCGKGACGGCGVTANGKPILACTQRLDGLPKRIFIEPLYYFPVLYDLVVDFKPFWEKLKLVKPYRDVESSARSGEKQPASLSSLHKSRVLISCNACGLCCSACPEYGLHKGFVGPSALINAYRTDLEERDQADKERRKIIDSASGVWRCSFVNTCSEVCPKQIDVAANIQQFKLRVALNRLWKG